jgi:hypothetical protein
MKEKESVPETFCILNHLTRLVAREDFIKSSRRESFKFCITNLYGEETNRKTSLDNHHAVMLLLSLNNMYFYHQT